MEEAITGDFALVKAWKADKNGNLIFRLVFSYDYKWITSTETLLFDYDLEPAAKINEVVN